MPKIHDNFSIYSDMAVNSQENSHFFQPKKKKATIQVRKEFFCTENLALKEGCTDKNGKAFIYVAEKKDLR